VLSAALHDWWITEARPRVNDHELVVHLEAEGVACRPDDDWLTYRVSRSGAQHWEGPPSIYGAELVFKGVTDASVTDPARVGNYTIAEIAEDDGALISRAEPDFNVTLHVSTIDVIARDRK
jgi:hypothetical protein